MMFPRLALIGLLGLLACSTSSDVSRELGARCDDGDDCDARCLPPADFPGGFCSISCEGDGDCPSDAGCVDLEGGVCLFQCADDAACRFLGEGWACASVAERGSTEEVMVCAPAP